MTQSNIPMSNASFPKTKRVLLGEQTLWTLLTNIVHIFRRHFGVVVGTAFVPFVPPVIIITLAWSILGPEQSLPALIVAAILVYINLFLLPAALTVVLSDICLGNTPTLKRAFARVLGQRRWWHLFTTAMLVGLAMLLGMILLLLPALWVIVRTWFAMPIVVLEDRRNRAAIRRSFALTKGQAWRLSGLFVLTLVLSMVASFLLTWVVLVIGMAVVGPESALVKLYLPLSMNLISYVLGTLVSSMFVVLLYYDQRVRRESYDAQALAEDLMR
jgi:hypothetical protein